VTSSWSLILQRLQKFQRREILLIAQNWMTGIRPIGSHLTVFGLLRKTITREQDSLHLLTSSVLLTMPYIRSKLYRIGTFFTAQLLLYFPYFKGDTFCVVYFEMTLTLIVFKRAFTHFVQMSSDHQIIITIINLSKMTESVSR